MSKKDKIVVYSFSVISGLSALLILFIGEIPLPNGESLIKYEGIERLMCIFPALISAFFYYVVKNEED